MNVTTPYNHTEDISESFLIQMTMQLTPQINDLINIKIKDAKLSFIDIPPNGSVFNELKYKDGWTISRLFFNCAITETVTLWVKWRSLTGEEYVDMKEETDETKIEFLLCSEEEQLPYEYEIYGRKLYPEGWPQHIRNICSPQNSAPKLSFPYEVECGFPDVFVQIYCNKSQKTRIAKELKIKLPEFFNSWNAEQEKIKPNRLYMICF